jgi:hypothetical protein
MIALAESQPDAVQLSQEWHNITGDSFVVDVRPISQDDPASGFVEVFKYAVKFSEQEPADTVHAWVTLASKRLIGSAGLFRGVEVPESLLDDLEGLEDLPYITLFYRFLQGAGFTLTGRVHGKSETVTKKVTTRPRPAPGAPSYSAGDFTVAYENRMRDARLRVHKPCSPS